MVTFVKGHIVMLDRRQYRQEDLDGGGDNQDNRHCDWNRSQHWKSPQNLKQHSSFIRSLPSNDE